jgi:hypothetical protein
MSEMFQGITIGVALCAVGVLLVVIGMPKKGVSPRFLRFEAASVLYPALVMSFLAFGAGLILRAL